MQVHMTWTDNARKDSGSLQFRNDKSIGCFRDFKSKDGAGVLCRLDWPPFFPYNCFNLGQAYIEWAFAIKKFLWNTLFLREQ